MDAEPATELNNGDLSDGPNLDLDPPGELPIDPSEIRPYWIPPGLDCDSIPQGLRAAITEVLQPVYISFVVMAADSLERATGLTVVHLLWHEILEQYHLGQDARIADPEAHRSKERREGLQRLLQIVGKKHKVADLLLRLRMFSEKNGVMPGL